MKVKLMKRLKHVLPASLLISFTFFIFGVLEMYITNIDQFEFSVGDLLITMIPLFVVCMVVLMLVGVLLKGKARRYYVAVLFGLGLALYIQGNFLNNDFGILDGKTIDWSLFKTEQIISTVLWVLLPAAAIVLAAIKPKMLKKVAVFVSLIVVATQTITLVVSYIPVMGLEKGKTGGKNLVLTTEGEFELSRNENLIVFVVDTFDTKYARDLLEAEPEYGEQLDGFTFYDNAVSAYGYTQPSVPFILTGQKYLNEQPHTEYLKDSFAKSEFLNTMSQKDYDIGIYTHNYYVDKLESFSNLAVPTKNVVPPLQFSLKFAELIAFRYFPQLLKPHFLIYSGEINTARSADNTYTMDDPAFYRALTKQGLRAQNEDPVFRFYHLFGMHTPYTMNENAAYQKSGVTQQQQARGVMKVLLEYFGQMKELGIYDDATIVIMADHGYENLRSHAAVFIKQPKEKGALKVCNSPVSYIGELPATLLKLVDDNRTTEGTFFDETLGKDRERSFYGIVYGREYKAGYFNDLCEYTTHGEAGAGMSYMPTGNVHASKDFTDIRLGESIDAKDFEKLTTHGYLVTANNTAYSYGTSSSLVLQMDRAPTKNLKLTASLTRSLLWPNEISLYANGKLVGTVCAEIDKGEITFIIPKEFVENDTICLLFEYSAAERLVKEFDFGTDVHAVYSLEWSSVLLEETEQTAEQMPAQTGHAVELHPGIVENGVVSEKGTCIHPGGMMHGYQLWMPADTYYLTVRGADLENLTLLVQGNSRSGETISDSVMIEEIDSGENVKTYKFVLNQVMRNTNFVFYNKATEDFVVESLVLRDHYDEGALTAP